MLLVTATVSSHLRKCSSINRTTLADSFATGTSRNEAPRFSGSDSETPLQLEPATPSRLVRTYE